MFDKRSKAQNGWYCEGETNLIQSEAEKGMGLRQAGVTVLFLVLQVARNQARQHQLFHRSVGRTVEDTHHHRLLL